MMKCLFNGIIGIGVTTGFFLCGGCIGVHIDRHEEKTVHVKEVKPDGPNRKQEPPQKIDIRINNANYPIADSTAKSGADAKSNNKTDAKSDSNAKSDNKADVKSDSKSKSGADAKSNNKTDAKSDSNAKSDNKADVKSDSKSKSGADAKSNNKTDMMSDKIKKESQEKTEERGTTEGKKPTPVPPVSPKPSPEPIGPTININRRIVRGQNPGKSRPRLSPTQKVILLEDHRDLLHLTITAGGITSDEKKLAEDIVQLTTGGVSSDDAKVLSSGNGDVRLTIRAKLKTIDRDQNYYRMNCDVDIELRAVNSPRIFGTKTIKLVSPKRVLGKEAAVSQFDESASRETAEWCRTQLKKIAEDELGVAIVTLQLPSVPAGKPRNAKRDAAHINAIGNKLREMKSLVSYQLVALDDEIGACQYRVVYFKSAYPNGIANGISIQIDTIARQK